MEGRERVEGKGEGRERGDMRERERRRKRRGAIGRSALRLLLKGRG